MPVCRNCGFSHQIGQIICQNCNTKLIEGPQQNFPIHGDPPYIPPPGSPPDMLLDDYVNPLDPSISNLIKKHKKSKYL
jgi:hypothetical protein